MSATAGKILIDGVTQIKGEKVFALKFIQGRDPEWVNKIFFARYDKTASWISELKPAFGEKEFFFTKRLDQLTAEKRQSGFQTDFLDEDDVEFEFVSNQAEVN